MNGFKRPMNGFKRPMNGFKRPMNGFKRPMNGLVVGQFIFGAVFLLRERSSMTTLDA
jgi:hypothetical protein